MTYDTAAFNEDYLEDYEDESRQVRLGIDVLDVAMQRIADLKNDLEIEQEIMPTSGTGTIAVTLDNVSMSGFIRNISPVDEGIFTLPSSLDKSFVAWMTASVSNPFLSEPFPTILFGAFDHKLARRENILIDAFRTLIDPKSFEDSNKKESTKKTFSELMSMEATEEDYEKFEEFKNEMDDFRRAHGERVLYDEK